MKDANMNQLSQIRKKVTPDDSNKIGSDTKEF